MRIGVNVVPYDLSITQFLFETVETQLDYYSLNLRVFEGPSFRNVTYAYDTSYMKKRKKINYRQKHDGQ